MGRPMLVLLATLLLALSGCSAAPDAPQATAPTPKPSVASSPAPPTADLSLHVSQDYTPSRTASDAAGATVSRVDALAWQRASKLDRTPALALRLAEGIVASGLSMDEVLGLLGPHADPAVLEPGQEQWPYPVGEHGMLYITFLDYHATEYRTEGFNR